MLLFNFGNTKQNFMLHLGYLFYIYILKMIDGTSVIAYEHNTPP